MKRGVTPLFFIFPPIMRHSPDPSRQPASQAIYFQYLVTFINIFCPAPVPPIPHREVFLILYATRTWAGQIMVFLTGLSLGTVYKAYTWEGLYHYYFYPYYKPTMSYYKPIRYRHQGVGLYILSLQHWHLICNLGGREGGNRPGRCRNMLFATPARTPSPNPIQPGRSVGRSQCIA